MNGIDTETIAFVRAALAKQTKKSDIAEVLYREIGYSISIAYKIIKEVELDKAA